MQVVNAFRGVDRRSQGLLRTERAGLSTPRELVNFHIDANGHLYLPPADAIQIHDFGIDGPIVRTTWCAFGMVIQTTTKVWLLPYGTVGDSDAEFPDPPVELFTLPVADVPVWVNSIGSDYLLVGFATRGAMAVDGGTWKVESDGAGGWTVTDVSSSDPLLGVVSASVLYKGRRFIASRQRTIHYSDLNAHTTFSVDSAFEVAGDDGATSFEESIGTIQGMTAWEDVLVIFMRSSIWLLTGSGPGTWNLRQVQTTVGNSAPWSISRVEEGLLRFHQLRGDAGVYLFSGSTSKKVSDAVDPYLAGHSPNAVIKGNPYSWQSATWSRRYYLALSADTAADTQFLVYDLDTRQWTTFDGFTEGAVASDQNGMFFSVGNVLYNARPSDLLPRAPGRDGKVTLGWFDQGNTAGQLRFLAVKVAGRRAATGAGTASLTLAARVPDGGPDATATVALTGDSFDNVVLPVNLRGSAVELDFTLAASDDVSVVIESLQLVMSRKGEKVSRA